MELSALKEKIWNILSVKDDDLSAAVMRAVFSQEKLPAYYDLVGGDLSTD